jgi:competence protein ComFC
MLRQAIKKAINLVYPPLCLHCEKLLDNGYHLFCRGCTGFFELIDPTSRCIYCFAENEGRRPCPECLRKKRWHIQIAAALDYIGAVGSLIKGIKYGRMPYLANTASAFMAAQFDRLKWPHPDLIIPVPRRQWFQGENHAHLLATSLALRLQSQCLPLIKRRAGDFSQARLNKEERENLPGSSFYLKRGAKIEDKMILLVDDVITTGTTLGHCADTLVSGFPAKIFALSLARTI